MEYYLYIGKSDDDDSVNFMWVEDPINDLCRMIDWEMEDDVMDAHIDEFCSVGFSENFYGEWREGVDQIREGMKDIKLVAFSQMVGKRVV